MLDYKNLRTVKQLAENAAPIITEGKLRWWIFHAERNGFAAAIVRIGGRVYIDRNIFNQWLERQRGVEINSGELVEWDK